MQRRVEQKWLGKKRINAKKYTEIKRKRESQVIWEKKKRKFVNNLEEAFRYRSFKGKSYFTS